LRGEDHSMPASKPYRMHLVRVRLSKAVAPRPGGPLQNNSYLLPVAKLRS
jgi:hypothetical protein